MKPGVLILMETLINPDFGKPDLGYHCVTDMQNKPMSSRAKSRNDSKGRFAPFTCKNTSLGIVPGNKSAFSYKDALPE